ncbi:PepSY domain-containing protein [Enterococcus dongliensis]|uniref:PepSY domain-containing protein n=1 Tax=Enterococcus dongliensis TaxID=2559925 RepID=A0AAP5KT40_9ENTE|nr:PepSY domain-containing protein [Enterococcus dongliensis]MDT2597808.1 PepSY domain-containing protein [Enterococcus dongliensis]MDT2635749.1 PepSY domain-containing protein [Enterococcus dongliensis]MDT2638314.1 PepSY domain-containing protein [Enterococcus dongliensis]MDT2640960.1 PepSY domain-containing protein [Enterococcus dongliensis]MDT2643559.1 PepSY domain-containing protein [Enterococcus dongliensis]
MVKKIIIVGLSAVVLIGLAGCGSNSDDSSGSSSTQKTSQSVKVSSEGETRADVNVSVADAIKAYQEAYPDSDITSIDLETSLGKYLYKIEGVDDDKEYELRVDANTKAVSKEREENLDAEDRNGVKRTEDKLDLEGLLSIEQVSDIAEKHVGKGEAVDWSLDKDAGTMYWEVKVIAGQDETEVKIDATSGEVLETEIDD